MYKHTFYYFLGNKKYPEIYILPTHITQWSRRWGVGHFGVKFFGCFFGFLRPSYMHRGGGNCNLPSEKANKGPKSIPTLTQKVRARLEAEPTRPGGQGEESSGPII